MSWVKRGQMYVLGDRLPWARSHAQVPTVDPIDEDRWRIFFATRDERNRALTTFIEVSAADPSTIVYEHPQPILPLGKSGTFDDAGVMPGWIVDQKDVKYLYYCGWALREPVPYEIQVGLAVSVDGGRTWERFSDRPVLGRIPAEPLLTSTPCVVLDGAVWKAWYLSGTKWEILDERIEAFYHLKYAESGDGIHWIRNGTVAIDYETAVEGGIARPSVMKEDGVFKMWFCYRGGSRFREDRRASYRIGYAESENGVSWTRMDDQAGIDVSAKGWDSQMIAYPFVLERNGTKYMFYCGNGFGSAGFGYALWID